MKRRLLATACLILAGLCVACVIGWARSYVSAEAISASRRIQRYLIISNDGCVALSYGRFEFETPDSEQLWRGGIDHSSNVDRWSFAILHELNQIPSPDKQFLGFGAQRWEYAMTRRGTISGVTLTRSLVQFPFWFATILTGAWPAAWLWKLSRVRRTRAQRGLCRKCGFDLADVYYSCPRCGQRIPLPAFDLVAATPASPLPHRGKGDAGVAATAPHS